MKFKKSGEGVNYLRKDTKGNYNNFTLFFSCSKRSNNNKSSRQENR